MADEQKKEKNLIQEAFNDATADIKKSAIDKSKAAGYGIVNDAVDIFVDGIRKFVAKIFYPDGSAPKAGYRSSSYSGGNYRDYASYSRSSGSDSRRDRLGSQSATDICLVTWPNEAKARNAVNQMIHMIDESANNACRVGDLYELGEPKISTTYMDWKYGWTDKDKGSFDIRFIASGEHQGEWMAIVPKPHLL